MYGTPVSLFLVELHEPLGISGAVPEAFVHHLWEQQHFRIRTWHTVQGEALQVLHPGERNVHAGPDFRHAQIRIGDIRWSGDVEIHLTSADWERHGHHRDPAYNRVILHVTLTSDARTGALRRADGTLLPELVLYRYLDRPLRALLHTYYRSGSRQPLYCAGLSPMPDADAVHPWLEAMGRARLMEKQHALAQAIEQKGLEQALYEALFAGLGYEPNREAMLALAVQLPFALVQEVPEREALFLGQAGLLPDPADLEPEEADYAARLWERYRVLHASLNLPEPMDASRWKWARLRPNNFPTLRIVQGALLFEEQAILGQGVKAWCSLSSLPDGLPRLEAGLRPELPAFWQTHVHFGPAQRRRRHRLGRARAHLLISNVLVPACLSLGAGDPDALQELLRRMPPVSDRIVRKFRVLGIRPRNALESQGLHHVYSRYCRAVRCLECAIGSALLAPSEARDDAHTDCAHDLSSGPRAGISGDVR